MSDTKTIPLRDDIGGFKPPERVTFLKNAGPFDGETGAVVALDLVHGWRVWVHPDTAAPSLALHMDPDDLEHLAPVIAPGTTGTATLNHLVSGNSSDAMRVMRVEWDGLLGFATQTGRIVEDDSTTYSISDFVPDETRPTVSTEALGAVAHDVLAGPMYEASHAAMHVAEAITVYLSGHGWTPDTGPTAVEQLATVLAGKFGGHSDAYLDVASEVVAFQRGESR